MSVCKAGQLVEWPHVFDGAERELAVGLLASADATDARGRNVPASTLSRALANLGHRLGPTTIKDHRAGRCACARQDG